jgi:hypothetical protein
MHRGKTVCGREIDPRLPPCGVEVDAGLDRFLQHQFLLGWGMMCRFDPKPPNVNAASSES